MAKEQLHTFVLHDESVNTHGFRMLTSGADLTEFLKNPVMLLNHDDWALPIGRWVNIRIEEGKILAEADFDLADERGREVARKVADGYIRACSIGAWATESSDAPELLIEGQWLPTVTRWQVREASICTIGANHNALALYDAYGGKINMESKTDIETVIQLIDKPKNKKRKEMNKELLQLLSLSDNATDEEAVKAVRKLQEEKKELSDKLAKIERAEAEARLAKATLEALPEQKSITEQLKEKSAKEHKLADMSWEELDRKGKLQELRDTDPKLYQERFREQFGRDPQDN